MLRISCMSCIVGQVPVYRVLCCACIGICMRRWSGGQYATLIYPCVIPYSLRFLCNRRIGRVSLQEVACWSNQGCKMAEKLDKAYSFRGHITGSVPAFFLTQNLQKKGQKWSPFISDFTNPKNGIKMIFSLLTFHARQSLSKKKSFK